MKLRLNKPVTVHINQLVTLPVTYRGHHASFRKSFSRRLK